MVCSVTKLTIVTPTFHVYHCLFVCVCVCFCVCVCVCVCFVCGCGCGCFPPTPFPHPILPSPFSHPTPFSIPSPSPLLPCPILPGPFPRFHMARLGHFIWLIQFQTKIKKPKPNIFAPSFHSQLPHPDKESKKREEEEKDWRGERTVGRGGDAAETALIQAGVEVSKVVTLILVSVLVVHVVHVESVHEWRTHSLDPTPAVVTLVHALADTGRHASTLSYRVDPLVPRLPRTV